MSDFSKPQLVSILQTFCRLKGELIKKKLGPDVAEVAPLYANDQILDTINFWSFESLVRTFHEISTNIMCTTVRGLGADTCIWCIDLDYPFKEKKACINCEYGLANGVCDESGSIYNILVNLLAAGQKTIENSEYKQILESAVEEGSKVGC